MTSAVRLPSYCRRLRVSSNGASSRTARFRSRAEHHLEITSTESCTWRIRSALITTLNPAFNLCIGSGGQVRHVVTAGLIG